MTYAITEREEAAGSENSNRLAEGQGEGAERVRAKLKVMQEPELAIPARGTVTALPRMRESESYIFQVARVSRAAFRPLQIAHDSGTGNVLLKLEKKDRTKFKYFTEI